MLTTEIILHIWLSTSYKTKIKMVKKTNQIQQYKIILDGLSPQKILEQGYAFVTRDKTTITSSKKTKKDDELLIHFKDGEVKVKVR